MYFIIVFIGMAAGVLLDWYISLLSEEEYDGRRYLLYRRNIPVRLLAVGLTNGILWTGVFARYGMTPKSLWYGGTISAMIVLSVIDWNTYQIPFACNLWIFAMALGNMGSEWKNGGVWSGADFLVGAVFISGILELLLIWTKGRAVGGGDVKLMFAAGLLLGWKGILWAFFIGCMAGSVIHPLIMLLGKKGRMLAFGPYLSFGIWVSMMWGQKLTAWYIHYLLK